MNERLSDRNQQEQAELMVIILEQLGQVGIEGYRNMPRKAKKIIRKRALTQLEQSRLHAMRRQKTDA